MKLLLLVLALAGAALGQWPRDDPSVQDLPLCPGLVNDILTVNGLEVQLYSGDDVLDIEVSYTSKGPVTAHWFKKYEIEDPIPGAESLASGNIGLRSGEHLKIIHEWREQTGKGRAALKIDYGKFDKLFDSEIPHLEFFFTRENGLSATVLVEFNHITLSEVDLYTNQRLKFPQMFRVSELPAAEYERNTNDCKMRVVVQGSHALGMKYEEPRARQAREVNVTGPGPDIPPYDGNLPQFNIRSLDQFPKRSIPETHTPTKFFRKGGNIPDTSAYIVELLFAPDSMPESDGFEAKGYLYYCRYDHAEEGIPSIIYTLSAFAKRTSAPSEPFAEGGSKIHDGTDFLTSTFFSAVSPATIRLPGSDASDLVCNRHYNGQAGSKRSLGVRIEVEGLPHSQVPEELRMPLGSIKTYGSYGYIEWFYFPVSNPAWLLLNKARCRCRHTLADETLLMSPWKEVEFV